MQNSSDNHCVWANVVAECTRANNINGEEKETVNKEKEGESQWEWGGHGR